MKNSNIFKYLLWFISLIVLAFTLFIILLFSVRYAQTNLSVFSDFQLLKYASSWDRFFMGLYLFSALFFYFILMIVFAELCLWMIRLMAKTSFKIIFLFTKMSHQKIESFFTKLSIIYLLKKIRITSFKRWVILYVCVVGLIFLPKQIGKLYLNQHDSLVYRTYENINLNFESIDIDVSSYLSNETSLQFDFNTKVGNVHLYTISDTNKISMKFYYDSQSDLASLNYYIDDETNTFYLRFGSQDDYEKYVDLLPSQVELYIPEELVIGSAKIMMTQYGNLSIQYFSADRLEVSGNQVTMNVTLSSDYSIGDYDLNLVSSTVNINTKSINNFNARFISSDVSLTLGSSLQSLVLDCYNNTNIYIYQTTVNFLEITSRDSTLELRELYPGSLTINTTNDSLNYVNYLETAPTPSTIQSQDSKITIKGIVYHDSTSDTE